MNYVDVVCENQGTVRLVCDDEQRVVMSSHNESLFEGMTSEEVRDNYYPSAKLSTETEPIFWR